MTGKMHRGTFIDFQAQVGKRDAGSQRITVVGRRIKRARPVGFRRRQVFGGAVIKQGMIKMTGLAGLVILRDGMGKFFRVQPQLAGQFSQRIGLRARKTGGIKWPMALLSIIE